MDRLSHNLCVVDHFDADLCLILVPLIRSHHVVVFVHRALVGSVVLVNHHLHTHHCRGPGVGISATWSH